MTSRSTFRWLTAFVLCGILSTPVSGAEKITLGKKAERVIEGERLSVFGNPGMGAWYQYEFSIRLKAGQSISAEATVVGKERMVNVVVADPKGTMISPSPGGPRAKKSIEVKVEEVNATGDYKILVVSDLIGQFTLRVNDIGDDEESIEVLESKIQDLNAELAALEKKLKAAKARRDAK